jgi:hypothetical protein
VFNRPQQYADPRGTDYIDINIGIPGWPVGGGVQIGDGPPAFGGARWWPWPKVHPYFGVQVPATGTFSVSWAPFGQQVSPGVNIGFSYCLSLWEDVFGRKWGPGIQIGYTFPRPQNKRVPWLPDFFEIIIFGTEGWSGGIWYVF